MFREAEPCTKRGRMITPPPGFKPNRRQPWPLRVVQRGECRRTRVAVKMRARQDPKRAVVGTGIVQVQPDRYHPRQQFGGRMDMGNARLAGPGPESRHVSAGETAIVKSWCQGRFQFVFKVLSKNSPRTGKAPTQDRPVCAKDFRECARLMTSSRATAGRGRRRPHRGDQARRHAPRRVGGGCFDQLADLLGRKNVFDDREA